MRSVESITWKESAIIEVRLLIAKLEDVALDAPSDTINSVMRQAYKLREVIEHIVEYSPPPVRKAPIAGSTQGTSLHRKRKLAKALSSSFRKPRA